MNDEETQDEEVTLNVNGLTLHIPVCCSEGRDDCKHAVQKQRPEKRNVAL